MSEFETLIAVGKRGGRIERLGEVIDFLTANKDELDTLTGKEVVQRILAELVRLNLMDQVPAVAE